MALSVWWLQERCDIVLITFGSKFALCMGHLSYHTSNKSTSLHCINLLCTELSGHAVQFDEAVLGVGA